MIAAKVKTDRFAELDGLRGIAAMWVVLYHYIDQVDGTTTDPNIAAPLVPFGIHLEGLHGVHLFFIISGFVIFMTMRRSATVLDFAVSRAARLYPAFWVSLVLTMFSALVLLPPVQQVTIPQAIVNATMLHFFVGVPSVEPIYWSLGYEVGFYFIMAAIFACGWFRRVEPIWCVWIALSFVLLKLFPALGAQIPWRLQVLTVLPFASLFFAGMVFYRIWSDGATPWRIVLIVLCYLEHVTGHSLTWAGIMAGVFGVFSLCVMGRAKWLATKPFVFLGTISYSLYLLHGTLLFRLPYFEPALGRWPLVYLAFALAVTILAASAVTFLIERPANRAISAAYRRWTSAALARSRAA